MDDDEFKKLGKGFMEIIKWMSITAGVLLLVYIAWHIM